MRRVGLMLVAAAVAVALAGCGKSATSPAADGPPAEPEPTAAEKTAILAALPAPYNTADIEDGQGKFALCASCHTLAAGGPNMTGPHLHGILGRRVASVADFHYSDALKAANFTWDPAHLDRWITDPKAMEPGTKMTFVGLPDAKDRVNLIAYLMVENRYKP